MIELIQKQFENLNKEFHKKNVCFFQSIEEKLEIESFSNDYKVQDCSFLNFSEDLVREKIDEYLLSSKMLLDKINSSWATEFDNRTKGSSDKSNLKSLVTLRNSFAHGDTITATIENVITYFDSGKQIIEIVDDILTNIT